MNKAVVIFIAISMGIFVSSVRAEPEPNTYGQPYQLNLETKTPSGDKAAKETIPLWGFTYNCIPLCQSTSNELRFRFQETGKAGEFVVRMLGGVYYSLVKNFQGFGNDVVIDLDLLDANGYTIAKTSASFSRDECHPSKTWPIKLPPDRIANSGNPTAFPRPVRDAVSVRVTPHWIQRDGAMCDGNRP